MYKLVFIIYSIPAFLLAKLSLFKCTMYQRKVDVDMLNAVKSVWADISSISPSSEQS